MEDYKLGEYITKKRKEKNLSQEELAKKLGVSNKTVSKWECGQMIPNYDNVTKLCKILGIKANELINGGESKSILTEEETKLLLETTQNHSMFNFFTNNLVSFLILIINFAILGVEITNFCILESINKESVVNNAISNAYNLTLWFMNLLTIILLLTAFIIFIIKQIKSKKH